MRACFQFAFFPLLLIIASILVASPSFAVVVYSEDFEGVTLGPNVDEGLFSSTAFTHTPPVGWNIVNNLPGEGQGDGVGVTEWEGWSFANAQWWSDAAGDQNRSQFTNASGTVAVADPDEWDDLGNPAGLGTYNTFLSTGSISLAGLQAGSLRLRFDSSWRDEDFQRVNVTVSYDAGPAIEILNWTSTAGPNFHDDAPNEFIDLGLNNPEGANNAVITWGMEDGANDWWWAIDNISVEAPAPLTLRVDPVSGAMELHGNLDATNLTGYEITSASGSLVPAQWQAGNLAAQDIDAISPAAGDSWEVLFASSNQLGETFLHGDSYFDETRVESLGIGFMPGGIEDLNFSFSNTDGAITPVDVQYATIFETADFDENGSVDSTDLATWEDGFGQFSGNATKSDGDANDDGYINGSDLLLWQGQFSGGIEAVATSVPEPGALSLLALALFGFSASLRRRVGTPRR